MYKTSLALAGLVALSHAQQTGNVSVVLNSIQYSNGNSGNIISQNREQVDFAYLVGEWNTDYNVTADTDWFYNYEGEDVYELNNEEGDQIFLTPKQLGFDIPAILDTVTATNNGQNTTVADTIGDSVAQTYRGVRDFGDVSAANLTNFAQQNNPIQNAANNAQDYIETSTQNAIDALNQAQANQSPSQLQPFLIADQQYRDALQNLQNSYNQALANLSNAYNLARGAGNNAANQAGQAAGNAANSAQQAANNAGQAVNNAANQAGQAIANAPQRAANAANSAANQAGQAVGNAANAADNAANNAQQAVANAPQRAANAANNAANQAGQTVGNAANAADNAANNAQQAVANAPQRAANAVGNAANAADNAGQAVSNAASGVRNSFNNGLDSANNNQ